ncbi:MAG: RluA family pseudouridine synthase [Treponema sp.]|jgi:23S rRNA pseudouridine955/2504/2580 synthase|nr:RluA family pseudouridine synthase [Treponema sp.]
MKNVEILYEDDNIIILNKPAGLAVQGGEGVKSSLDRLLAEIRVPAPLLVHRLDKDTSGCILTAKTKKAAADLSRLMGSRKTVKQYIAVCAWHLSGAGIISADLNIRGSIKKAETKYKILKKITLNSPLTLKYSILELEPGTGRMHQIRRHLAMNGTPVLGDDKYGDFKLNKELRRTMGLKRLLLHASRLVINDTYNLNITAPLPEYFKIFYLKENNLYT